jgi:hypothetical protein
MQHSKTSFIACREFAADAGVAAGDAYHYTVLHIE